MNPKSFLQEHFDEDRSQRPEFDLGFAALRRCEIVHLAKMYDLPLSEGLPKKRMVPLIEAWWEEGRFKQKPGAANYVQRSIGELRTLAKQRDIKLTREMTRSDIAAALDAQDARKQAH